MWKHFLIKLSVLSVCPLHSRWCPPSLSRVQMEVVLPGESVLSTAPSSIRIGTGWKIRLDAVWWFPYISLYGSMDENQIGSS